VAYGARIYNKPSSTRTDLFITRQDARRKWTKTEFAEAKKKYRFMPSNDRAQQRWIQKSVLAKGRHTDSPKARGRTIMRGGTTMIGIGRAIPTMAVGWIAVDAAQRAIEGQPIQDQPITAQTKEGWSMFNENTLGGLNQAITLGTVGYRVSKTVVEIIL